jgi:uncharacterized membrane protein
MDKEEIHLISRHSNWSAKGVEQALKTHVYSQSKDWQQFTKLFIMTLGIGFTVSGIVFFFAYNWADLHKFAKIGMVQGLLLVSVLTAVFGKFRPITKNIILTGASVLVGVLFAVFGQVYQTGANAYDFFLGWTVFTTIWVLISNFAPLWLIWIVLINTTLTFYAEQVARDWPEIFLLALHFAFNMSILLFFLLLPKFYKKAIVPNWFTNILALAAISFSTLIIANGIFENITRIWIIVFIFTAIFDVLGIFYSLKTKSSFYLSIIFLSVIVIISSSLTEISHDEGMFLFNGFFILIATTGAIAFLVKLQKKWRNETGN